MLLLGKPFRAIGYGCWSVGNIMAGMLSTYLDHHVAHPNSNENFILQ